MFDGSLWNEVTMQANPVRDELLTSMDASRDELDRAVSRLGNDRLTRPADPQGWTGQDHLEHLAAWERSMVFLLQGKPRHEGLGVSEAIYLGHDYDPINESIRENTPPRSLDQTLGYLASIHEELRSLVAAMNDSDLAQPYAHFLPDEPGQSDPGPISNRVRANTSEHYREHLGYIEIIAGEGSTAE
jgi:hypothetical protein